MLHCWVNGNNDIIAADTATQASQWWDVDLSGQELNAEDWSVIDSHKIIAVDTDGEQGVVKMTAKEWAALYSETSLISSEDC